MARFFSRSPEKFPYRGLSAVFFYSSFFFGLFMGVGVCVCVPPLLLLLPFFFSASNLNQMLRRKRSLVSKRGDENWISSPLEHDVIRFEADVEFAYSTPPALDRFPYPPSSDYGILGIFVFFSIPFLASLGDVSALERSCCEVLEQSWR